MEEGGTKRKEERKAASKQAGDQTIEQANKQRQS